MVTTYPDSFAVKRVYNSHGYLSAIRKNSDNALLQQFSQVNAFGQVTQESYGNSVVTNRGYDERSGRLLNIDTHKGATVLQELDYGWRSNGVLNSRMINQGNGASEVKESFEYDPLGRLTATTSYQNSLLTRTLEYQYNQLGNLLSKTSTQSSDTQVNNYLYGSGIGTGAGPHAVTQATIDGMVYSLSYDASGALTHYDAATGPDRFISYNTDNPPTTTINSAGVTVPPPLMALSRFERRRNSVR